MRPNFLWVINVEKICSGVPIRKKGKRENLVGEICGENFLKFILMNNISLYDLHLKCFLNCIRMFYVLVTQCLDCLVKMSSFSGFTRSAIVTLDSVQIFKTHEWLEKPTFYFKCQGENLTVIPDVKKTHVLYTFKGEESWQVGRE